EVTRQNLRAHEICGRQVKTRTDLVHKPGTWIPPPGTGRERRMITIGYFGSNREVIFQVRSIRDIPVPEKRSRKRVFGRQVIVEFDRYVVARAVIILLK